MKRSILSTVSGRIAIVILIAGCLAFSSYNTGTSVASEPLEVALSGTINHTDYTKGQSGTITFNRFPATVEEFKQVREQIGGEPHGAIALQLMAYEMYRRDRKMGEECIRLNSTTSNIQQPLRRLNELFSDKYSDYARPYQIAAFLKGASPKNGYNPPKPYTIEVRVNPAIRYQESSIFQTEVLYLQVLTQGRKNGLVGASVLKTHKPGEPSEGTYFIVLSCGDFYFQAEPVSFTAPFNGLD